jgi:hypothetical protein
MQDGNDAGKAEPGLHTDEGWKRAVAEEKRRLREQEEQRRSPVEAGAHARPPGQPTIQALMAGLYTQTLMALGELENPVTGAKNAEMGEAAFLIDTIAMLQEKTRGNLTADESSYVQNVLTDLRMRYVRATQAEAGGQEKPQ